MCTIRGFGRIFATVALMGLMMLLPLSVALSSEKVRFETDWIITGKVAPFFMGLAKGFFKEQGLDVAIFRGYGSAQGVKDLIGKTVDYSFVDCVAGIVGISSDNPVRYVSIVYDKGPHVVVSLAESGIRTPKDLVGKRIGAALAETGRYVITAVMRANGVNPDDVVWVTMPPGAKSPSLLAGKIDASPELTPGLPPLARQAKQNNKTVSVLYVSDWGVDVYSLGILTHQERIKEKSDEVKRFVHASTKAWAWSLEHPEEMLTLFKQYAPETDPEITRQIFQEAVKLVVTDFTKKHGIGWVDRTKMERTIEFATTYLELRRRLKAEEVYTNEYLPRFLPK